MTHSRGFGQKFTPIRRFSAWKTHPFWPHIPNMTFPGKLKGVLHSQEDGTNIFPSQLHNMSNHVSGGGGGGTSTSFVRECVATGLENRPIRRLKLAQKQTHSQTICNRN